MEEKDARDDDERPVSVEYLIRREFVAGEGLTVGVEFTVGLLGRGGSDIDGLFRDKSSRISVVMVNEEFRLFDSLIKCESDA